MWQQDTYISHSISHSCELLCIIYSLSPCQELTTTSRFGFVSDDLAGSTVLEEFFLNFSPFLLSSWEEATGEEGTSTVAEL